MSQSDLLLSLVEAFPQVFADPETPRSQPSPTSPVARPKTSQPLLEWIDQFPELFTDPDTPVGADLLTTSSVATEPQAQPDAEGPRPVLDTMPLGYSAALQRSITTFTWGQIDCYLTYGDTGLERLWIAAGKSGTEVQSLCEAVCRLVNLLLSQGVPLRAIVKELRGIRGADAEGLGPNRILGLADLIGKVVQDAPPGFSAPSTAAISAVGTVATGPAPAQAAAAITPTTVPTTPASAQLESEPAYVWSEILTDHQASLCPECGAELQQINGCSGGACQVCGYSSCS